MIRSVTPDPAAPSFGVLVVCTANICRSASAAALLRDAVAASSVLSGLEVRSAGTHALVGAPGCRVAPALAQRWEAHTATQLTPGLVDWADLILVASREHGAAVAELSLPARTRTFTIRRAGRIADWLLAAGMLEAARPRAGAGQGPDRSARYAPGDPRAMVAPLPEGVGARMAWLVDELDAARAMAAPDPGQAPAQQAARRWSVLRRSTAPATGGGHLGGSIQPGPDDIADPHVLGTALHAAAHEQLCQGIDSLVSLLVAVRE
jgi:protein-tyrosine-phosphatase